MAVAGCDYSSKFIDIVKLDEDSDAARWYRVELKGQDAFDRARDVRDALFILNSDFWDDVVALGIEQPRGNFGVVHVARIQGAILSCLPRSLLVQPLNPSSWRKTVGLPGGCTKYVVGGWVDTVIPGGVPLDWPLDATDAYAIAWATRSLLQHGERAA